MSQLVAITPMFGISLILALSCYLVLKSGEISFGQQAFFGTGAYAGGILTTMFDWPLAAAFAASAAAGAVVAAAIVKHLEALLGGFGRQRIASEIYDNVGIANRR